MGGIKLFQKVTSFLAVTVIKKKQSSLHEHQLPIADQFFNDGFCFGHRSVVSRISFSGQGNTGLSQGLEIALDHAPNKGVVDLDVLVREFVAKADDALCVLNPRE